MSYIFSTLVDVLFLDNLYFIKIYLTLFIQKLYKVFGFTSRQRRNRSKKVEEREETMGFSAMDETLIKSRCLLICYNFNLNYITHADVN